MSQTGTLEHHAHHAPRRAPAEPKAVLTGLLAEYETDTAVISAARRVRDAGYTRWDVHSPYPVHGIDPAMGIRPTKLPVLVFLFAATGTTLGLLMQWWMNAVDYAYTISGKPFFSLPAFIPIIFEVTILFGAISTVILMLVLNDLPTFYNPLFTLPRFRRATDDRFFIAIDARDPKFSAAGTQKLLEGTGAVAVERVEDRDHRPPPRILKTLTMAAISAALIPAAWVAYARVDKSDKPRIHIIYDMDNQEKFPGKQAGNPIFADGRAIRPPVPGTVARGHLENDPQFFAGRDGEEWVTKLPMHRPELRKLAGSDDGEVTLKLVERGQRQWGIYCAPCHGLDGAGNGPVAAVAAKKELGWVPPKSMHDADIRARPLGHLFNTISNGIRTMPPYGDQIAPADRWAIVSYIRALQLSQNATINDVPADKRSELR